MLGSLTPVQIRQVLESQVIGRIGCYSGDEVYVVPVSYAYRKGYIYAHSHVGRKIDIMRSNPNVCFQVDAIERMNTWRSVILWGTYQELETEHDRGTAMKILTERLTPLGTSEVTQPSHGLSHPPEVVEKGVKTIVYRIRILRSSGRYERTPDVMPDL
jgi:hypothetical protein